MFNYLIAQWLNLKPCSVKTYFDLKIFFKLGHFDNIFGDFEPQEYWKDSKIIAENT